jgi:AcrR family transcriptional regulator
MPKVVDRELMKADIAHKAIPLFRQRGYRGLSFREIARELGMSKSGLYHYFSSKEELFAYCGQSIFQTQLSLESLEESPDLAGALLGYVGKIEALFRQELALIAEFAQEFPQNPGLQHIHSTLSQQLAVFVGNAKAEATLRVLYGELLYRTLFSPTVVDSGQREDFLYTALMAILE